jgi:hypothetical protein
VNVATTPGLSEHVALNASADHGRPPKAMGVASAGSSGLGPFTAGSRFLCPGDRDVLLVRDMSDARDRKRTKVRYPSTWTSRVECLKTQDVSGQVAGPGRCGHIRFSLIKKYETLWQPQIISVG